MVVDPRPVAVGFATIVVLAGVVTVVLDTTDTVTNEAELPTGWFGVGLAALGLIGLGGVAGARRLCTDPLVGALTGMVVALVSSVLGLIAFTVTGAAALYCVAALGTLAGLALATAPQLGETTADP